MLESLAGLGIRPTASTTPERVRALVNELYRYELRRLRDRLLHKEFPKADYIPHVLELRRRYWVLSVPVPWLRDE
ncbi:MAG: hypothetical protein HYZ58_16345 [Acidobacteria bacterium]|nr:hypothetical protein [Acidobacteriota bacterium]MBI3264695.1 hypothetical protein [Acidobacteriota bacterium]